MPDLSLCPRCGGPLPKDVALGGGCPRCMLELGFDTSVGSRELPEPSVAAERPKVIGRYRILRLIGEGGMGAVYEAEQDHPRRTVALKIIKSGMASAELLRRFEQESQALGRLQHPGIAQIYEAGTVDTGFGPQPYFAMEFIRGQSPRAYAEAKGLSTRDRLQMMVKICEAVHHAHQRGLIHRDLKPGNILVDETGQPKILDFGVARVTDSDARATLQTDIGQLVGTLAYMSPEQALADPLDLDTRSDVYSLGVILYELLSGRLPYSVSKKVHEAIQAIREEDPALLSASNRTYRGDIETIVAKALEKERERRYASAAEMAADIQRYLNDEPIIARPPSASYQLQKFARRNTALVMGVAAVFAVLVVGLAAFAWQAAVAGKERDRALKAEGRANENEREATQALARETDLMHVAEDLRVEAGTQRFVAQQQRSAAEVNRYSNSIYGADREWTVSNIENSDQLLNEAPVGLRNWEWYYLTRRNHMEDAVMAGHPAPIIAMSFDRDGNRLRTIGRDGTFKDWDLNARKETATGTFGRIPYYEIRGGVLSNDGRFLLKPYGFSTAAGVFSPRQGVWDLSPGKALPPVLLQSPANSAPDPADYQFRPMTMSPDGSRVVGVTDGYTNGSRQSTIRTWDIDSIHASRLLSVYTGSIQSLTFSPTGDKLAVIRDSSISILNSATGQELAVLDNSRVSNSAVVFSRDSELVAALIPGVGIRVWNAVNGKQRWSNPTEPLNGSTTFSPDSRIIATALADRTIRLLDSDTGRELLRLMGQTGIIRALSFTPDGKQLVSAGDDKVIHIWKLAALTADPEIIDVGKIESPVRVSPDNRTLLTSTREGLKAWDLKTGQLRFESGFLEGGREMSFSRDGNRIVSVNSTDGNYNVLDRSDLQVLDTYKGDVIALLHPPREETWVRSETSDFQISPSGNRAALILAILTASGNVAQRDAYIWDVATGTLICRFALDDGPAGTFQFSPDGKFAALSGRIIIAGLPISAGIDIYDTTSGKRRYRLDGGIMATSTFSHDGNRLLMVEGGRSMTIWDVRSGAKLVSFPEAGNTGTTLISTDFSPSGSRLVSVSSDGEVWVWDTGSGRALIPLRESGGPYEAREVRVVADKSRFTSTTSDTKQISIAFSPDGRKITLTTVVPDPQGSIVRIETWDGSPRQN